MMRKREMVQARKHLAHGPVVVMLALALGLSLAPVRTRASEPQPSEAQAYEVIDSAGNTLFARNENQQMDPASITKVMTAMVALDSGKRLDDVCTLSEISYQSDAQIAGIKTGDTLTLRQLLMIMLIFSANDAADNVALAVSSSKDAFVNAMNDKAREIGMTNTHFSNTHGLMEPNHHSTAADLVKMGKYALEHYPLIAQAVRTRSYTVTLGDAQRTFNSTDDLMETYTGLIGIKTGSVESGYAFLGASVKSGLRLYSCVLGCTTGRGRFADTATLMDWAYEDFYKNLTLARAGRPVRIANWSLGFGRKIIIRSLWTAKGLSYPGADIHYATTMADPGSMVDLGTVCGSTVWSQDGRALCYEVYVASDRLYDIPNVSIFSLPLFVDASQLKG